MCERNLWGAMHETMGTRAHRLVLGRNGTSNSCWRGAPASARVCAPAHKAALCEKDVLRCEMNVFVTAYAMKRKQQPRRWGAPPLPGLSSL